MTLQQPDGCGEVMSTVGNNKIIVIFIACVMSAIMYELWSVRLGPGQSSSKCLD